MNNLQTVGTVLTAAGVVGYLLGVFAPYPGRGFSVAGVMVGLTFLSIGGVLR
ncbi:hypothetical protein [Salinigranum halophilum]|jgi:hypothetical protein|uniref:hypothetical protein n=1 Tax=Salinigranum halophilum TaxID=2565931 RepID=UPI00191C34D5|nr:hypothetical protein [Salinigranum halophilum]